MYDFEFGSRTAKGGFANEKAICKKFNNWKYDEDAKLWLKIMGYDQDKIDYVEAIQIPTRIKKADIGKFGFSEEKYEELMWKTYWYFKNKGDKLHNKPRLDFSSCLYPKSFAVAQDFIYPPNIARNPEGGET